MNEIQSLSVEDVHLTRLAGAAQIALDDLGGGRWRLVVTAGPEGFRGRVQVRRSFPFEQPWFMLPGVFSGTGRRDRSLAYAEITPTPDAADPWQSSTWSFALERMTMPLAGVHDGAAWRAMSSATHYSLVDGTLVGASDAEPQVGFECGWSHDGVYLAVNLPAVEGPIRHVRNPLKQAVAPEIHLQAGGQIACELTLYHQVGARADFGLLQRQVFEQLRAENPVAPLAVSLEEYARIADAGLRDWHWQPATDTKPGYFVYTAAMDRSVEYNANVNRQTTLGWHFDSTGFVGGFPVAYGILSRAYREQIDFNDPWVHDILRYVDRLAAEAPAVSGLLRTSYHPGAARTRNGAFPNGPEEPGYGSCWSAGGQAQARTTADATWYLARLASLCADGHDVDVWKTSCENAVRAAMRAQFDDGQHPHMYDVESGAASRSEGDGGLLWVPAMLAVARWCDEPLRQELLASARAAGRGYAAATQQWWLCGAPEDIGISPSSEDAGNAVMAYARLYEIDRSQEWLDLWKTAADYLLAWRKAYNVRFDPATMFAQADLRTTGGDFASNHNNHLHGYAMNCLQDLRALSGILNDDYYTQRAEDCLHFFMQLLCRVAGQWNGQRGMLTEQFYTTDWSIWDNWNPGPAHVQKGTMMGFSHSWCINMVLLGVDEWLGRADER
jgi:hypothetical protein